MAPKAAEVEEATDEGGLRSQMYKHEAMVEWINENEGVDLDQMNAAEIIAYAFARRNEWRKSDEYRAVVDNHAAEVEAAKAEKAAARKAAAAEKENGEKPAKASKSTKAAKAAKATKTTKKAAKGGDENPFD